MKPLARILALGALALGAAGAAGCSGVLPPPAPKDEAWCNVNAVPCRIFKYEQCCVGSGSCAIDVCDPTGFDPVCAVDSDCDLPIGCAGVVCAGSLVDPASVTNPSLCPTTLASAPGAGDRVCFMHTAETPQQACAADCNALGGALNSINWPIEGNLRSVCSAALNTDAAYHGGLMGGFVPNGCMDPGPTFPLGSEGTNAIQLAGSGTASLNGGAGTPVSIIGGFFDIAAPNTGCSALQATCPTQINQVEVAFSDFTLDGHSIQGLKLELDAQVLTASGTQSGSHFIFVIPQAVTFDAIATVDGSLTALTVVSTQEVDGSINLADGSLAFQFDVSGLFDGKMLEASGVATSAGVVAVAPVLSVGAVSVTPSPDACTAALAVTASASSAAGLPVAITYAVDDRLIGTGAGASATLSIGTRHLLTVDAEDSNGMRDTVTQAVTPADTLPPTVTIADDGSGYAGTQWSPAHGYVAHTLADCVSGPVVDQCDGALDVNAAGHIVRITSDEPEDAPGDGNTCADMVITGPSSFQLRSEREGRGDGRVYTVEFTVTDAAGNSASESCSFQVPHDQGGAPAVAGAPVYCVGSGCGGLPGNSPGCR